MTTRPHVDACARASSRSCVTTTPLPAARPSSFTTYGGPISSRAASAASAVSQTSARAVGTPAAAMTSLANAFDPSSRAAAALGPKQSIPRARTASAAPATRADSGPMTTRSAPTARARSPTASASVTTTGWQGTSAAMPALPGAQRTSVTAGSSSQSAHQGVLAGAGPDDEDLHDCQNFHHGRRLAGLARRGSRCLGCRRGGGGRRWREGRGRRAGCDPLPGIGDGFLQLRVVALETGLVLDDPGQGVDLGHQRHGVLLGPLARDRDRHLVGDHRQLDAGPAVGELAGVRRCRTPRCRRGSGRPGR